MFKKVMAVLLATVAFMPAARAQAGEGQDGRDAGISRRGELQRMRERGGNEGQRVQAQRAPEAPRPERQPDQPRPAAQVRAQAQVRNDGYRGGEGRGNLVAERAQRQQADAQVQAQVQAQAQLVRQRDGDRGRGNRQGNWQRDDAGRTAPVGIDRRRTDEARRTDADNRGSDRRFDGQRRNDDARRNGGQQRWDTNRGFNDGNRNAVYNGRSDWNRGWRDDNRYDWGRYRQQNRSLFRLPGYYAPYGWNYGYRRYSIGVTLSSLLWEQDYWIDDPAYYRLPPAYGPYRWVRYYNDALLVDIRSGYVVDTVYDIFW